MLLQKHFLFMDNTVNQFCNLEKVEYKIFDKKDSLISHLYSPISEQDKKAILKQFNAKKLALLSQEHSNKVQYVDKAYCRQQGDAMVTDQSGIILALQTADCVCTLLASSDQKVIAAVHLGWKGAASNLLQNTLQMIRKFSNAQIVALVSPCIRQESYEVDKAFADNFIKARDISTSFFKKNDEKLYFDLPGFVKEDLRQNGIINISDSNENTYTNNQLFSFRLAKHNAKEERRRLLSCITLKA
jgi:YfiH family protein